MARRTNYGRLVGNGELINSIDRHSEKTDDACADDVCQFIRELMVTGVVPGKAASRDCTWNSGIVTSRD
jgi:hypothetical protein